VKYCATCAARVALQVPPGEDRQRYVCTGCGEVHYQNPRVVVGSVPVWEDRLLLCRRAIEPQRGLWTLPAGFLELDETSEEGARREAWEEARAQLELTALLAVYDLTHVGQVQLFYAARLLSPDVSPGEESLEVDLFRYEDVPRDEIAFPSVHWALDYHQRVARGRAEFPPDRRRRG